MKKQITNFIFIVLMILSYQTESYAWPIPHSGVTKCYDNEKEIPCPKPGEPFYGQSGNYIINPKSFTKLDEKGNDLPDDAEDWLMVRDNVTGLIWEVKQAKDDHPDYNNPHDSDNTYTWYDTNPETNYGYTGTYNDGRNTEMVIKQINESRFGGFEDWLLPSIKELGSLTAFEKLCPAINELYFRATHDDDNYWSAFYWSSTSRAYNTGRAWGVYFNYGYDYRNAKDSSYFVRAVRGGQCRSFDHLVINADQTVTDTSTGLIWSVDTSETTMNWGMALKYCENYSLADYSDWRLPEKEELRSIVDYTRYSPTIDTNYFKTLSAFYWSSTSHASNTGFAWGVDFYDGYGNLYAKDSSYFVRAVRGGQCRSFGHLIIWSPMQAAILITGTTIPISWDTANIDGNVKITLSRQGGKADTFEIITPETQNDGHYEWTITGSPSPNCMLTIEPVSFPYSGTQQSFFTIKNPDIRVNTNVQASFSISGPETFTATGTSWTTDNALPGDYTITYSPLACWQSPAQESQSLTYWATLTFQGAYTPLPPLPVQHLQAELPVETWSDISQISIEWDALNECTQGFAYVWDNKNTTEPPQTITTKANQIVSPKLSYGNNHWFHIRTIDIHGNASETVHIGPFYINRLPTEYVDKAIIVAGGPTDDPRWPRMLRCANYAYEALAHRGYHQSQIRYLVSDRDMVENNSNSQGIIYDLSTSDNLKTAITSWASDAKSLFVYLIDHGGPGTFLINENEILKARDLDQWMDLAESRMSGNLYFLYEACFSGSFVAMLKNESMLDSKRIIMTSASNEDAHLLHEGALSFSYQFWASMFESPYVYFAFNQAQTMMQTYQTPQLDADGDGIANEKKDGLITHTLKIGKDDATANLRPKIITRQKCLVLNNTTSQEFIIERIVSLHPVQKVWATIVPPKQSASVTGNHIIHLPEIELNPTKNEGQYAGTYANFHDQGLYKVSIYAQDEDDSISLPAIVHVFSGDISHWQGDINMDQLIDLTDVIIALQILSEINSIETCGAVVSFDGDHVIDMMDVLRLMNGIIRAHSSQ
jgi:hypothetical protein